MNNIYDCMLKDRYTTRTYYTLSDIEITPEVLKSLCTNPDSEVTAEFIRLFFLEYGCNWAIYCDSDKIEPDKVQAWKDKFEIYYSTSYNRYSKLIQLYKQEENNLLNKLGSKSETRFNDTPQDLINGATDGFNTTVTTNSVTADPGEMILRLKAISDNYRDLYGNWITEFRFLFGESLI